MTSMDAIKAAGSPSALGPLDLSGIQRTIDAAMQSVKADKHGNLIIQLNPDGVNAGIVARGPKVGPFETSALATFVKPKAGPFSWGIAVGAQFGVMRVPGKVDEKIREAVGWWIVLAPYNSPKRALWKAVRLALGFSTPIAG